MLSYGADVTAPDDPFVLALPTADRRTAHAFYTALGFDAPGEPADDGVPEPLQIAVNPGFRLMLIPTGGFGWVTGDHEVAAPGHSECLLSLSCTTPAQVDEVVGRAERAGGRLVSAPASRPWGYTATFADPDAHLWQVLATSL